MKNNGVIQSNGKPLVTGLRKLNSEDTKKQIVQQSLQSGIDKASAQTMVDNIFVKFEIPKPTNRKKRVRVGVTDDESPYLKDLWDKIAHKVNYRVNFNESELINEIVNGDNPISQIQFKKMTAVQSRARIDLLDNRVTGDIVQQNTEHLTWANLPIIDVTREIADQVELTQQAIIQIILQTNKNNGQFITNIKMNPSLFVKRAVKNIKAHEQKLLNQSLVYVQTGDKWRRSLLKPFNADRSTLWDVPERGFRKTLFKKIIMQSHEEESFAQSLVNEEKIKYFLKLPPWFKIPTPFGNYNPDWAILAESDSRQRLYFVVDTKTTTEMNELRNKEQLRIIAGRRAYEASGFEDVHFEAPITVVGELDI